VWSTFVALTLLIVCLCAPGPSRDLRGTLLIVTYWPVNAQNYILNSYASRDAIWSAACKYKVGMCSMVLLWNCFGQVAWTRACFSTSQTALARAGK